ELAELTDQALAMITQRGAVTLDRLGLDDLLVQQRDVLCQAVDFGGHGRALLLQCLDLRIDVAAQTVEALCQVAGLTDDLLAQGNGARRGAGFAERSEELVEAGTDARTVAGHQRLQRSQILLRSAVEILLGGRTPQLLVVEFVGHAADADHFDTAADTQTALPAQ